MRKNYREKLWGVREREIERKKLLERKWNNNTRLELILK